MPRHCGDLDVCCESYPNGPYVVIELRVNYFRGRISFTSEARRRHLTCRCARWKEGNRFHNFSMNPSNRSATLGNHFLACPRTLWAHSYCEDRITRPISINRIP